MSEWQIKREAQALAALKVALAGVIDEDDDQALRDLAEGETELLEAIDAVMSQIVQHEEAAEDTQKQIKRLDDQLKARKAWFEGHADKLKRTLVSLIEQFPEISGARRPFGTIFVGRSRGSVVIDSEDQIPAAYKIFKPAPAPVPDKEKIRRALADGDKVPGARLVEGSTYLGVRK